MGLKKRKHVLNYFAPCIMCVRYRGDVQYYGECLVPWGYHDACGDILSTVGVFSTMEDIMSTMGVILSTMRDVQYRGGYHDKGGDTFSTVGDIMSTAGVILSTMGDTQYCGGML